MGLATEVTLPRMHKAVFPDKCIVCLGKPDATVTLTHSGTNILWLILLPVVQLFTIRSIKAPICQACKPKFLWSRLLRFAALVAVGVALFFLLQPLIGEWRRIYQRMAMIVVGLAYLIPYFIYEASHPPPFDITRSGQDLDYEFRSEEYAREFRELNAIG